MCFGTFWYVLIRRPPRRYSVPDMRRTQKGAVRVAKGICIDNHGAFRGTTDPIAMHTRMNIVLDFLKHAQVRQNSASPDHVGPKPYDALARKYTCAPRSVRRFVSRFKDCYFRISGESPIMHAILALTPKTRTGPTTETTGTDVDHFLKVAIARCPQLELLEIKELVEVVCGVDRSIASLCRDFKRLVSCGLPIIIVN